MPREECSFLNLCRKYDCEFGICEASDENDVLLASLGVRQCAPNEKVKLAILASIDEKLAKLLEK